MQLPYWNATALQAALAMPRAGIAFVGWAAVEQVAFLARAFLFHFHGGMGASLKAR